MIRSGFWGKREKKVLRLLQAFSRFLIPSFPSPILHLRQSPPPSPVSAFASQDKPTETKAAHLRFETAPNHPPPLRLSQSSLLQPLPSSDRLFSIQCEKMATTLRSAPHPRRNRRRERRDSDVLSTSSDEDTSPVSHLENTFPPFEVPNFTTKEVLGAIPAECFERSAAISFAYVARDFAFVAALGYAASFIEPALGFNGEVLNGWAGFAAKWAAWAAYWTVQGWVNDRYLDPRYVRSLRPILCISANSPCRTGHECRLGLPIAPSPDLERRC